MHCREICTNGKDSYHDWNIKYHGACLKCNTINFRFKPKTMKDNKRFADIKKMAHKIWVASGKACVLDINDKLYIEVAKKKIAGLIEQLEELITRK